MTPRTRAAKNTPAIGAFLAAGFPERQRKYLLAAMAYFRREGHLEASIYHFERGINLARWKYRERAARRAGQRSQEQIALLESIGMRWEGRRGGKEILSSTQKAEIVRSYNEDKTPIRVLAAKSDCAYGTIHRALDEAGVQFRARGPAKSATTRA